MILTNEQAATIRKVLRDSKTIAIVGLSPLLETLIIAFLFAVDTTAV